jgi:Cu-processing system permease protein
MRSRVVLYYTLILFLASMSVLLLEDNVEKGVLSLLNILLLVVPLLSIIYVTIYLYNSSEFIELLIAQPMKRNKVWNGIFIGLTTALSISLCISVGLPLLLLSNHPSSWWVLLVSEMISAIFAALGFLSAVNFRDKSKGIGFSIILWIALNFIFDGILMLFIFQFSDYPIEPLVIALAAINPVDMARISLLLQLDLTAMLGYTGALFGKYFGKSLGALLCFMLLLSWVLVPFLFSLRKFIDKDH